MAIIGHTAASMNIFLDILTFLWGLSQCMLWEVGPEMCIGTKLLDEIEMADPMDLTRIVEEYNQDWWNFTHEWEMHLVEVDQEKAFKWHIQKVKNEIYIYIFHSRTDSFLIAVRSNLWK